MKIVCNKYWQSNGVYLKTASIKSFVALEDGLIKINFIILVFLLQQLLQQHEITLRHQV